MELLRIVTMFMIIVSHIFCHCIKAQLTNLESIQKIGNGWYCYPIFSKRLCVLAIISPLGQVGNGIFIMISGYFMAHKETFDLTKISFKLLSQLGFAALILGIISIYGYQNITDFSLDLIQFSAFNEMAWFVGYYFIVIVIAKVYLNRFLKGLEQKEYVTFLVVLFALVQFVWSTKLLSFLALDIVCIGIFLYSCGGYIKRYNPFEKIRLWAVIAIIIITNLIIIGNFYIKTASSILAYNPDSQNVFIQSIPEYLNNQAIPVVLAISVFELFRRIKIPNNSIINYLGASTFMVYLVHDNGLVYKIWGMKDWITLLYRDYLLFSKTYVVYALTTFFGGYSVILYIKC